VTQCEAEVRALIYTLLLYVTCAHIYLSVEQCEAEVRALIYRLLLYITCAHIFKCDTV
jgi:hypothetical protein